MAQINIKVDDQLKQDASKILNDMGLDLTTGIKIYLKRVQQDRKIPFEVRTNDDVQQLAQKYQEGDPSVVDRINRLLRAIAGNNNTKQESIGNGLNDLVKDKSQPRTKTQGIGPSMLRNIYRDHKK